MGRINRVACTWRRFPSNVFDNGEREAGAMRQTKRSQRGKRQRVNELLSERALLCIIIHALKPGCFL